MLWSCRCQWVALLTIRGSVWSFVVAFTNAPDIHAYFYILIGSIKYKQQNADLIPIYFYTKMNMKI